MRQRKVLRWPLVSGKGCLLLGISHAPCTCPLWALAPQDRLLELHLSPPLWTLAPQNRLLELHLSSPACPKDASNFWAPSHVSSLWEVDQQLALHHRLLQTMELPL